MQPAEEDREKEAEQSSKKSKEMEKKGEVKSLQPPSHIINRWFQS